MSTILTHGRYDHICFWICQYQKIKLTGLLSILSLPLLTLEISYYPPVFFKSAIEAEDWGFVQSLRASVTFHVLSVLLIVILLRAQFCIRQGAAGGIVTDSCRSVFASKGCTPLPTYAAGKALETCEETKRDSDKSNGLIKLSPFSGSV